MGRWKKLVFVNPDRVHSEDESVHLLFDLTDPSQENEVRILLESLEDGLELAREYRSGRVVPGPQTTFPWGLAGRCLVCGGVEPCDRCAARDRLFSVSGCKLSIVPDPT